MGLQGGLLALMLLLLLLLLLLLGTALGQDVTFTEVASVAELQKAVADGFEHIVVNQHLDVRDADPQYVGGDMDGSYALDCNRFTRTVRGRCMEAPARSDLAAEWVEGQCVLDFATSGLLWSRADTVWLDHLYLKMSEPESHMYYRHGVRVDSGTLYLTEVTIEGEVHAPGSTLKVEFDTAVRAYAAAATGLRVLNFHPTGDEPILLSAAAYLVDSCISNNVVAYADGAQPNGGAISTESAIKLERVVFGNNSGNGAAADYDVLAWDGGLVYSDADSVITYYDWVTDRPRTPRTLCDAPDVFPMFDDYAFLTLRDQAEAALQSQHASEHSPCSPSGAIAGALTGALALIVCAAAAVFMWRRRQRSRSLESMPSGATGAVESIAGLTRPQPDFVTMTQYNDASAGLRLVPVASKNAPTQDLTRAGGSRESARLQRETAASTRPEHDFVTMEPYSPEDVTPGISLIAPAHFGSSHLPHTTSDIAMLPIRRGHGDATPSAPTKTDTVASMGFRGLRSAAYLLAVEVLEDALEHMLARRQLLMGTWQVLAASNRRVGGQGVVQFIKDAASGEELVAKFFLDAAAFRREAELYGMPEVREMMAAVVSVQDNADGSLKAPNGLVLPPFIVLERGRSLHEWALVSKPDYVTTLQVLVQIVKRLCALHACGLAHRDIKPANILWRSSKGAWTLIDFGCATPIGQEISLACSAPYAAPEVAQAFKDNCATMEAHTAVDIWALGVVIWELFTDRRAFPGFGTDEIFDALTGPAPLPWEADSEQAQSMRKLGLVRRVVAQCLSRDPGMRPTAEELYISMDGVFQTATTMQEPKTSCLLR